MDIQSIDPHHPHRHIGIGVAWRGVAWRGVAWRGVHVCAIRLARDVGLGRRSHEDYTRVYLYM